MNNVQQHGLTEQLALNKATKVEENIRENTGSLGSGLAICVAGFPAAGKSIASEEVYDVFTDYYDDVVCVDIAEFIAEHELESMDARSFVGQLDKEFLLVDCDGAVFDGVRSMEQIEYISKFFDEVAILYIVSHHGERHMRLIDDARGAGEDLDEYSHDKLRKRDEKAGHSGLYAIENAEFYDMELRNEDISEYEFRQFSKVAAQELILNN